MGYPLQPRLRYPYGPATRFTTVGVQPPAAGYLGPSDQLSISVLSPNTAINFNLALRFLDLAGNVQPLLTEVIAPATGTTPFILPIQVAEGFLLSATAFGATVKRGQCWVQLLVLRQKAADIQVVGDTLMQGYVSATDNVSWPGQPVGTSTDGAGFLRTFTIPDPAVGSEFLVTVPPATRWRLQSMVATLTTSAAAGFRGAILQIKDAGGFELGGFPFEDGASASSVMHATQAAFGELTEFTVSPTLYPTGPIPIPTMLGAGFTFGTLTLNLDAGDQWSSITGLAEEWVEA